jgi:hypothetical protein
MAIFFRNQNKISFLYVKKLSCTLNKAPLTAELFACTIIYPKSETQHLILRQLSHFYVSIKLVERK